MNIVNGGLALLNWQKKWVNYEKNSATLIHSNKPVLTVRNGSTEENFVYTFLNR
jgi:hypothetical protein